MTVVVGLGGAIKMIKSLIAFGYFALLSGCATTTLPTAGNPKLASENDLSSGNFSNLNICRVSSIKRSAEAPEIRVNKEVIGQLGSGAKVAIKLKEGTTFELFLPSNLLMYRFSEAILYSKKMSRGDSVHLILIPESNVAQGLAVFLGGALAESVRQSSVGQNDNWTILDVPAEDFEKKCLES